MTDRKAELIATLKQVKVERKAYSLRLEKETLEQVEDLAAATGKNLNDVLNLLIEIGLTEFKATI